MIVERRNGQQINDLDAHATLLFDLCSGFQGWPHHGAPTDQRHITAFAQVDSGMEAVDAITRVARDGQGRWGPKDRPLEPVVIERITIEPAGKNLASSK